MDPLALALLIPVGVAAGIVNTLAGGGSFVTLSALVWLGLPAPVANATNRVGVLAQSAAAAGAFRREGVQGGREAWAQIAVTGLGAGLGAAASLALEPDRFEDALALGMLGMLGLSLARPAGWTEPGAPSRWRWVALLAAGAYGGFLQAGVGLLLLPGLVRLGGLDPIRANARKVLLVGTLTVPALAVFVAAGAVAWVPGLLLAIGSAIGGAIGARLTIGVGARGIWAVLVAVVVATAARLWLD